MKIKFLLLFSLLFNIILNKNDGEMFLRIGNGALSDTVAYATKLALTEINKNKDFLNNKEMNFTFGDFKIIKFNYEDLEFVDNQFTVSMKDNLITVKIGNGTYEVKYLIGGLKKAELDLDVSISAEIKIQIKENKDKTISFEYKDAEFKYNIKKLKIDNDFILKFLSKIANNSVVKFFIVRQVRKVAEKKFPSVLDSLNSILGKPIDIGKSDILVQMYEASPIIYTNDYNEYHFNFNFSHKNSTKLTKKSENAKKLKNESPKQSIKISVNQELFNSFIETYLIDHQSFNFTSENIPKNIPFKLNTVYFSKILPPLYKNYPNEELIVTILPNKAPNLHFHETNQKIDGLAFCEIQFKLLKDPSNVIFSVQTDLRVSVLLMKQAIYDNRVYFNIEEVIVFEMEIKKEIGEIDINELRDNFNIVFKMLVYGVNKAVLDDGVAIPKFGGVQVEHFSAQVTENFFTSTTEVVFDETTETLKFLQ